MNAGTYEFKITDGQWNTEDDKTHEWGYSNLGADYEEVSQGVDGEGNPNGNIKIVTEEAKNITVIFDATAKEITFEGLTVVTHTYTIAGDAALCGEAWNWELAANDMTNNGDGTYTWTKAGVEVNGELSFKVFVDHKSEPAYPSDNWVIKPENYEGVGVYDVTITFTESSKEVAVALTKQAVVTPTPEVVIRTVTKGYYYTICMPKAMTNVQGASFWQFVGRDADFAYIEPVATPTEAGKPYLMYAIETGDVTAVLEGEDAPVGKNGALYGTFEPMDQDKLTAAGNNIYLLVANELRRVDGQTGNSLPANRAYVDLDDLDNITGSSLAPNVRRVALRTNIVTGVDNVDTSAQPVKTIINGQLFILRGEKMYDAQGKLVK
jgi:hypothetical protein